MADLADAYVNDAFGTAHRAHASTAGVAAYLPSYAGYLMEREVATLTGMLDEPRRPFVAILGGSKVSDKIKVIDALLEKADTLIIGGGMCFTFLAAQGKSVGTSLMEADWVERAGDMMKKARRPRRVATASRGRRVRRCLRERRQPRHRLGGRGFPTT